MTAAFYLNNREVKRELNVYNNGNLLPPCSVPKYLGAKLDRSLTFCCHLEALRKNSPPELRCGGDLRDLDGVQVTRHCASPFFPWSTLPLSTVHQFGV